MKPRRNNRDTLSSFSIHSLLPSVAYAEGSSDLNLLTRSLPPGIFTDSHPGGQHFWQCCFRFWRKGWVFHCQTNSKCNTTWSKSNVIQTYDGAKVTVFVRFESESARRRHVHCSCSRSDVAPVEIFTGPAPIDWTQEATMVKVRIFFYLRGSFKCMIVILPTFWRSAPALKFSWQLTRNVSLATMLVYSYRRSLDEDGRWLWVGTPRSSFTASRVVNFFSPGAPVTSFLCQPISTAIPFALAFNKTKPALSSIAVVSKAFKRTARTSLCRIWEHPQRCFPPFGQKPCEA